MLLDLRSLMVFITAIHLLFALLLFAYGRTRDNDRALTIWSACNLVGSLGWLLISLRGFIVDWLSIPIGNALLLLSWTLLWAGMRCFSGRPFHWGVVPLPALGVWLLFEYVPPVRDNLVVRIVLTNLGLMLCLLVVGRDALRDEKVEPLFSRRLVVLALMSAVATNGVRVVLSLGMDPNASFLAQNGVQELGVFAQGVAVLAWNIGLLLMARERLENELIETALRDPLTNVLNRAGFRDLGNRQIQRSARDARPLSVLLMDLDHFKRINDSHGHEAGDRLLCAFTDCARRVIRPTDLLARYGGEEFCALLPNSSLAEARHVAERLRADFEAVRIATGSVWVGATVSIGVAEVRLPDESIEAALGRADAALYFAKHQGRNQVCDALPLTA